jgi:hypothetical protein
LLGAFKLSSAKAEITGALHNARMT